MSDVQHNIKESKFPLWRNIFRGAAVCLTLAVCLTVYKIIYFPRFQSDILTLEEIKVSGSVKSNATRLHQVYGLFSDEPMPQDLLNLQQQCKEVNKDLEAVLWDSESIRTLIATRYAWLLETYDSYSFPVQRADVARYVLMAEYGGIYADLDLICQRPLNSLLHFDVVLSETQPYGVTNDFMSSHSPHHPFWDYVLERLIPSNRNYLLPHATVMIASGPNFLSRVYTEWKLAHPVSRQVRILPFHLSGRFQTKSAGSNAFFGWAGSAKSWHKKDTAILAWIFQRKLICLLTIALALFCMEYAYRQKRGKGLNQPVFLPL